MTNGITHGNAIDLGIVGFVIIVVKSLLTN